jgi:hypothetical protein
MLGAGAGGDATGNWSWSHSKKLMSSFAALFIPEKYMQYRTNGVRCDRDKMGKWLDEARLTRAA